jgi:hypothetical protein
LNPSSGDIIIILLGLGYGELYDLVNMLFYQMVKYKSGMYQISVAATLLLVSSLTFHTIIADYQIAPYAVSDKVLAVWAILCAVLTSLTNIMIYIFISLRIWMFYKVLLILI